MQILGKNRQMCHFESVKGHNVRSFLACQENKKITDLFFQKLQKWENENKNGSYYTKNVRIGGNYHKQ